LGRRKRVASHLSFFKQWGGFNKKKAGRELEGRVWDEMPVVPQRLDINRQSRDNLL